MAKQLTKKYPLQIAIGTLFITITAILAVILSWQSFNKTSDIMLNSARDIYQRITRELALDFKSTYGSIPGELRQFRLSPVIKAETFPDYLVFITGKSVYGRYGRSEYPLFLLCIT